MPRSRLTSATFALVLGAALTGQDPAFPGRSWPTATPESQHLDGASLAAGIAALPFPANLGPMVIVANGQIVHTVGDPSSPRELFSCSKLVTGMLAATLIERGAISGLDATVPNTPLSPAAPWDNNYPGDASVRDFLTMTSDYGLSPYRPAGGQFAYNNNGIHFLGEHLAQVHLGLPADSMDTAVDRELFSVLQREDPLSFNGQWGGWFGGLRASARDVARLGYLLLRGGQWQGQRLLDEEFVDGLFTPQIPASARRYDSSDPNENTQWNQQQLTNELAEKWSMGLWRVGNPRPDGSFACVAAEGYRGKRIVLMPRGSLPDPLLEVVLVTLPQLPDEGPPSTVYRDLIANAVASPQLHPDHDARCGISSFDDGTLAPLEPVLGAPFVAGGAAILDGEQRLVHRAARLGNGRAVLHLSNGLTAGSRIGITIRASSPLDDWNTPNGQPTTLWVRQHATQGAQVEVVAPNGPGRIHRTPWIPSILPNAPMTIHVHFASNLIGCRINSMDVIQFGTVIGVPRPNGTGYLSVRSQIRTSGAPARLDYVMFRPDGGPVAQVQDSLQGHVLGILDVRGLLSINLNSFVIETAGFPMTPGLWAIAQPFMWPNVLGIDEDHFLLSTDGARAPIPSGTEIRFRYDGHVEGAFVR